MEKICPMKVGTIPGCCCKEGCAWYVVYDDGTGDCAILDIALSMEEKE